MKYATFVLPNFYANLLINGDETEMAKFESKVINRFIADHHLGLCVSVGDDAGFQVYHDLYQYGMPACDCSEYVFEIMND